MYIYVCIYRERERDLYSFSDLFINLSCFYGVEWNPFIQPSQEGDTAALSPARLQIPFAFIHGGYKLAELKREFVTSLLRILQLPGHVFTTNSCWDRHECVGIGR